MNNGATAVQQLCEAVQAMQNQLGVLQAQNTELRQAQPGAPGMQLDDAVLACVPPHLQQPALQPAKRKRLQAPYPRAEGLPKHLRDDNGFASKAVQDATTRKWAITSLSTFQREALDIARVAAVAWQRSSSVQDPQQRVQHLQQAMRDVLVLACDNAQRMARVQLDSTFEAAGVKGTASLVDFAHDIDPDDPNILQAAHVESMQECRKFYNGVQSKNKTSDRPNGAGGRRRRPGGRNGGRQGWRGGRGRPAWRGGRGGYSGGSGDRQQRSDDA